MSRQMRLSLRLTETGCGEAHAYENAEEKEHSSKKVYASLHLFQPFFVLLRANCVMTCKSSNREETDSIVNSQINRKLLNRK